VIHMSTESRLIMISQLLSKKLRAPVVGYDTDKARVKTVITKRNTEV